MGVGDGIQGICFSCKLVLNSLCWKGWSNGNSQVNVKSQTNGVYDIRVFTTEGKSMAKFIKQ